MIANAGRVRKQGLRKTLTIENRRNFHPYGWAAGPCLNQNRVVSEIGIFRQLLLDRAWQNRSMASGPALFYVP
jgi:hypothetical protein